MFLTISDEKGELGSALPDGTVVRHKVTDFEYVDPALLQSASEGAAFQFNGGTATFTALDDFLFASVGVGNPFNIPLFQAANLFTGIDLALLPPGSFQLVKRLL